ncbi:MAG: Holliday junction branch migration DNA helicase RuvB [candidate division WOR-3 bacterium]
MSVRGQGARLTSPEPSGEDTFLDSRLRPRSLSEFIGQAKIKELLSVFLTAAREREEPIDHVLLSGPPGLGKTTLAGIIAREQGAEFRSTSGPALERQADMAGLLTSLKARDVLFIDEVHRLPKPVEEFLYPALEDFRVDIIIGEGPGARSIRLSLEPYTLIGATTRQGLLSEPLRARFGISFRLDYYPPGEIEEVLRRSASILGIEATDDGLAEIARRSRGTPRVANRLLKRVRDFAQVKARGVVDLEIARYALSAMEVDSRGLDEMDKRLLKAIIERFRGGPVGLKNLSVAIGEDPGTIEEVYEPFLIREGLLQRTSRGRVATPLAYEHLGYV